MQKEQFTNREDDVPRFRKNDADVTTIPDTDTDAGYSMHELDALKRKFDAQRGGSDAKDGKGLTLNRVAGFGFIGFGIIVFAALILWMGQNPLEAVSASIGFASAILGMISLIFAFYYLKRPE